MLALLLLALAAVSATGKTIGNSKNEKLHGGIEIGSKGVKATALNFTRKGNGYEVKILYTETINTTIMKVNDNRFTPEAINDTVQAVPKMFTKMQQEYQISPITSTSSAAAACAPTTSRNWWMKSKRQRARQCRFCRSKWKSN